jgi:hypothetical protein
MITVLSEIVHCGIHVYDGLILYVYQHDTDLHSFHLGVFCIDSFSHKLFCTVSIVTRRLD